jgi:glycosyltransferase involved in cell wall biosynthesis
MCERALHSALAQTEPPLEVLVCDNGSTDDTESRMRAWEQRDGRIRYLRAERNSGTPATTRNLGMRNARGELIAFLDDDDEWLAGKLAAQTAAGEEDVIATNALRNDGTPYFAQAPTSWRPRWIDILRANPIVASSALVRRERLLAVGGFPTASSVRGLEDYAAWLALARDGASFLILGEPLVRYDDGGEARLSHDRARIQLEVARMACAYALRRPIAAAELGVALRHAAGAAHVLSADARSRALARLGWR